MAAEGLPMSTPPSMAAMGPDWYQSESCPGLVIDFCTSPGRTGNSTYQEFGFGLGLGLVSHVYSIILNRIVYQTVNLYIDESWNNEKPTTVDDHIGLNTLIKKHFFWVEDFAISNP